MKSIKRLFFVVGCVALCNSAFADQLELANNIVYGTASDFKRVEQHKPLPLLKQVQVKINNGNWRDVPMTYSRGPISLNNNDQYAIRVQAADGKWYHTHQIKYSAARDGSSKNLGINGPGGPLDLVQDGIEVAGFYNDDEWVQTSATCSYDGSTRTGRCTFDARAPVGSFVGQGTHTKSQTWSRTTIASLDPSLRPSVAANAFVMAGPNDSTAIVFVDPADMTRALGNIQINEHYDYSEGQDSWKGDFQK